MARVVGIRVSRLFTIVFALGAGLAGFAGMIGTPILSVYPGLDQDMLPLALVVVILGGTVEDAPFPRHASVWGQGTLEGVPVSKLDGIPNALGWRLGWCNFAPSP